MQRQRILIGLVIGIAALPGVAAAETIFVDASAPPGGDGTSWATAYDSLHDALLAAGAGDEVWVAAGTYRPDGPGGDRQASFVLPHRVEVYGGFGGDEQSRDERDWSLNETILSGDLDGDDGDDFANIDDNSRHVAVALGTGAGTRLDGFTVMGGHAEDGALWAPSGAGLYAGDAELTIQNCSFRGNVTSAYVHDSGGGGVAGFGGRLTIVDCVFNGNAVEIDGGGLLLLDADEATVIRCTFANNTAAVGAGLHAHRVDRLVLEDSRFHDNVAEPGGGGAFIWVNEWLECTRTEFRRNESDDGSGLLYAGPDGRITSCLFAGNLGGRVGAAYAAGRATFVNCVFSRNTGTLGGGMYGAEVEAIINCSFSRNTGSAVVLHRDSSPLIANSIFWENGAEEIREDPAFPGSQPYVSHCDVRGGWAGDGESNIDEDPRFVQPGTDDLRLSLGSPCVNAGDNDALPPGTEEDIDGNPRILEGIVDMGAYEGENEQLPPSDEAGGVDRGEFVVLVPSGGGGDPEQDILVFFRNVSGPDGATVRATEFADDRHPGAGGYSEIVSTVLLETSLADGEFFARVFMPYDQDDLGGVQAFDLDGTYFAEATGNWALGPSANTQNSPGHPRPVGDRILREGPSGFGMTNDVGDYGVFRNSRTPLGFAWANVDHAAEFGLGTALCPADNRQPPDGAIDVGDILSVLAAWGAGDGPYDVNKDGTVDVGDILAVLEAWGLCAADG